MADFVKENAPAVRSPLVRPLAAGAVNQDAAHGLGSRGEEMCTTIPLLILVADQPQPGLMHQCGRLQRVAVADDARNVADVDVQVDGNVSFQNIPLMVAGGANMLVGGTSSVFHKDYSIPQAVTEVRKILQNNGAQ